MTGRDHQYGYGYEGQKEEQNELGLNWIDYGARNYDPAVGRWFGIDNMAEKFYDWTPYKYGMNNPIFYTDPDGNCETCWTRFWGVVQAVGGVLEMAVGAVGIVAPEPATSVGGSLLVANGWDNAQAGIRSALTGESKDTFLHMGVEATAEALGASPETANTIATVTEAGVGFAGMASAVSKGSKIVQSADNVADAAMGPRMVDDVAHGQVDDIILNNINGRGRGNLSNTGNPLPSAQTNGGRAIDVKTGQPLGGSGKARAVTVKHSSRKRAKDAARRDGKGTPVKHTKDRKGGNHYHAGSGKKGKGKGTKGYGSGSGKISNNVHHEY
ncbi:MAG: hypothetical protein MK212_19770 [Saprospiraceae bacterium]|nr:hypothetical protein [Saprospiraceae bacterium]